jgi:hypothetical protein
MAITTPEKGMKHMRDLVEAAKRIQREEREDENNNFQLVMDYFKAKSPRRQHKKRFE